MSHSFYKDLIQDFHASDSVSEVSWLVTDMYAHMHMQTMLLMDTVIKKVYIS